MSLNPYNPARILANRIRIWIKVSCRRRQFAQHILNGVRADLLGAHHFLKCAIERAHLELADDEKVLKDRLAHLKSQTMKLNEHGFEDYDDFFTAHLIETAHDGGESERELLDIIRNIQNAQAFEGDGSRHTEELENHDAKINALERLLSDVERISPIVAELPSSTSVSDLERTFDTHGCGYLLRIPAVVNMERVVDRYLGL